MQRVVYRLLFALAAVAVAVLTVWVHTPAELPAAVLNRPGVFTARVTDARYTESATILSAEIDSVGTSAVPRPVKARLLYVGLSPVIDPGMRIRFAGTLKPVESSPPAVPDEIDYAAMLRREGFRAAATISPDSLLAVTGSATFLWRVRHSVLCRLYSLPLSADAHSFLAAVLTADSSALSPETRSQLTGAGVAHILALSGLHVGILAMVIAFMLFPLKLLMLNRLRIVLTIIALWAFALFTGMPVSVVRAVIMASFVLGGQLLQRKVSPLRSLCAAAVFILIFRPFAILSAGFQMSFLAVAAILLVAAPLNPVPRRRRVSFAIVSYLLATLAATASAGMAGILWFHRFPLYFLAGNAVASLLLAPILVAGVLLLVVGAFMQPPGWMCVVTDFMCNALIKAERAVATLLGAIATDLYFSPWVLAGVIAALGCVAVWARNRRPAWLVYSVVLAVISVLGAILTRPVINSEPDIYVARHPLRTDVVIRLADSIFIATTAREPDYQAVVDEATWRYEDYRGRRGLLTPRMLPDPYDAPGLSRRADTVIFHSRHLHLPNK